MAYYDIEPFGPQVQARQQAKIGSMIVNSIRGLFGFELLPTSEFLLTPPEPPEETTNDRIEAALESNPFFRKIES